MEPILTIRNLSYSYKDRKALDDVSFEIYEAEIFGFLGPNGGGKSTLFKILSTYLQPQSGELSILDRKDFGVVFQNPSLDKKLTIFENLKTQGYLYGLSGLELNQKIERALQKMDLQDRKKDFVETLSGGLQRRVEIAKVLLHSPKLLILDEPTTGLDPRARLNIWKDLKRLQKEGVTSLVTTHLMEDAENCDRIGILDLGKLVCIDTPENLKKEIGGDIVSFKSKTLEDLKSKLKNSFQCTPIIVDNFVRVETKNGSEFVANAFASFGKEIDSVTLSKPSLEDVFIHKTGHTL